MHPWRKNAPLNFGSDRDPESVSGVRIGIRILDLDHILLGGRMRSRTALVTHEESCTFDNMRAMR